MRRRATRKRYYSQEELTAMASNSHHPKQAEKVKEYLAANWYVYGIKSEGTCQVIMMQRGEMHGVMYPNGRFIRPAVGKKLVQYNWADVRASAAL